MAFCQDLPRKTTIESCNALSGILSDREVMSLSSSRAFFEVLILRAVMAYPVVHMYMLTRDFHFLIQY